MLKIQFYKSSNGYQSRYWDYGNKSADFTILFIHGFAADCNSWQYNLYPISKKYRVIAVDLPGHGINQQNIETHTIADFVHWLTDFVKSMDIENRLFLVGHSFGALVSLNCIKHIHFPACSGISLVAPSGLVGTKTNINTLLSMSDINTAEQALSIAKLLLGTDALIKHENLKKGLLKSAALLKSHTGKKKFIKTLTNKFLTNGMESFNIKLPLQVIIGNCDKIIDFKDLKVASNIDYTTLGQIGHLPHIECASQVNAKISSFISSLTPGEPNI